MEYKKQWRSIIGGVTIIYAIFATVAGLIEYIDVIIGKVSNPSWIGTGLKYVLHPQPWALESLFLIGLILVWWDNRLSIKAITVTEGNRCDYCGQNTLFKINSRRDFISGMIYGKPPTYETVETWQCKNPKCLRSEEKRH